MSYVAPVKDMMFCIEALAGLEQMSHWPGSQDATADTARAVLEENARFVQDVVAPMNRAGDLQPASWNNGVVTTTPGFKDAFKAYGEAGWQGVQHDVEYGGQGLPKLIATPCIEMLNAANLSFALCPLLTDGAIEALMTAGSDRQKLLFLEPLISGRWTGTMNLTEPQAGSDLAQVRTRATRESDGTYRLYGTKIYITFGEHDMAENIVHLVLARCTDAPEGVKGISLFLVPKFLVNDDGSLGKRNDVYCASIEHKLGIKASPTAVLLYGDDKGEVGAGAIGTLIGEENRGLEYMFIMMNAARFAVGMQGVAIADRAYQHAVAYARDRIQSRDVAGSPGPVAIINHPDVRRMLLTMRALTEAARAMAYVTAAAFDGAHRDPDPQSRKAHQAFYEYMVPIVKGFSTEMSIEVTSLGVQVHGGMGFIEETGAAQYYRDARILPIYEGTTAIQANDLIGRKTARDGGATAHAIAQQVHKTADQLLTSGEVDAKVMGTALKSASTAFIRVVDYVASQYKSDIRGVFAGSVPYLRLAGLVLGGWQLGRSILVAEKRLASGDSDSMFLHAKINTARFFADHLLSQVDGIAHSITEGSSAVLAVENEAF
jgi:butyryl-CoA dehydrogenase